MRINNHTRQAICLVANRLLPWVAAFVCSFITYRAGTHGLYYFDAGIPYQFGWLVKNGYVCFKDILMPPLGPATAAIIASGYYLFGTTYLSGVYMASILAGVYGFISTSFLSKLVHCLPAILLTFAFYSCAFPGYGYPFYSVLSYAIYSILILVSLLRITHYNTIAFGVLSWTLVSLAGLVKPHFGALLSMLGLTVEVILYRSEIKAGRPVPSRAQYCLYVLSVAIGGILFLWAADFNVHAIIQSVSIPTPKTISAWYKGSYPAFIPFYTLLLPVSIFILLAVNIKKITVRYKYKLIYFLASMIIVSFAIASTTGSVLEVVYLTSFGACLVWMLLCSEEKTGDGPAMIVTGFLMYAILYYQLAIGGEKTWSEYDFSWDMHRVVAETKYSGGFFHRLVIRKDQATSIRFIEMLSTRCSDKKIFFGPTLEMFYPATGRLPPKPWLLWSHPGTSVNKSMYKSLESIVRSENYDILVVSRPRADISPYLFELTRYEFRVCIDVAELDYLVFLRDDNYLPLINEILTEVYGRYSPQSKHLDWTKNWTSTQF